MKQKPFELMRLYFGEKDELYGFNFNPHEYPGLYDWGRKTLYGE